MSIEWLGTPATFEELGQIRSDLFRTGPLTLAPSILTETSPLTRIPSRLPCPPGFVRDVAGQCRRVPQRIPVPQKQTWSMSANFGVLCVLADGRRSSRIGQISLPNFVGIRAEAQGQVQKYAADWRFIYDFAIGQQPELFRVGGTPGQGIFIGPRPWTCCSLSNIRVGAVNTDTGDSVSSTSGASPAICN
jgi:hypothetical protein